MKFFLYSQCGEGAQLLRKIELEGNECAIYIRDKIYKDVFKGLLNYKNPDEFVDKDTIILFDMSGNGTIADSFVRRGHYVYGASIFADDLEHDRAYGFKAMTKFDIKIPEYKEFKSFGDGIKYVRDANKRLVFKPTGSMPVKLTYVPGDNPNELEAYMMFVEKQFGKDIESFILQEFIEGTVISSEAFCGPDGFIPPYNHTVEVKKSMNDELGPSTGCSGNITWICDADDIITNGIAKIEELCKKNQYIGQIDLNTVVNDQGVYGLEWTPRFGYDATPTLMYGCNGELGKFYSDICRGQVKSLDFVSDYLGSLRVTIPPYPAEPKAHIDSEKFSPNKGVPIQNYEDYEDNLYLYEVCLNNETMLLEHSGGTGVICCIVGLSDDIDKVLDEPRNIADELIIPDKQYRTDLDTVLPKMVKGALEYA